MRVLLDEMVPIRLHREFDEEFHVETVQFNGWKGVPNGDILPLAQAGGFDCVVTRDRSLPDQQHLARYHIAVVVARPRDQAVEDWIELLPEIQRVLRAIQPGQMREVAIPVRRRLQ